MINYDKYWQVVKAEAEYAKHMAALWKRCAKKKNDMHNTSNADLLALFDDYDAIFTDYNAIEARAKKAEAERDTWQEESDANLAALKETSLMLWEQSANLDALKEELSKCASEMRFQFVRAEKAETKLDARRCCANCAQCENAEIEYKSKRIDDRGEVSYGKLQAMVYGCTEHEKTVYATHVCREWKAMEK